MYDEEALRKLIDSKALLRGDFTLASGKKASFFLDCKQVTLDARGNWLVSHGLLELLKADWPDAVGGMSIGADPITAGLLAAAASAGKDLRGFLVRKERKDHGTEKYIEGPVQPGDRVTIVEDVVTTGGSSMLAIDRAEAFGLKVARVLAIVDRLAGGREAFAARGLAFDSLFTLRDFGLAP